MNSLPARKKSLRRSDGILPMLVLLAQPSEVVGE